MQTLFNDAFQKRFLIFFLFFLYGLQFWFISKYAVNIPFMDEWGETLAWEPTLSWDWVVAPHNEHRIIPTKIQSWILSQWTGANYIVMQQVNFLLFGVLLFTLYWFLSGLTPAFSQISVLGFLIFCLSTLNSENHNWGFQSQFHYCFIFLILTAGILFKRKQLSIKALFLAALCGVLSMYSFAAGVVGVLVLGFGYLFLCLWERSNQRITQSVVLLAIWGLSAWLWFSAHEQGTGHVGRVSVFSKAFWGFFANIIALGFGVKTTKLWVNLIADSLFLVPFGVLVFRLRKYSDSERRTAIGVLSFASAILAILAVTALGRAPLGLILSKSPRYNEMAFFLLSLSAVGWALVFVGEEKKRKRVLFLFWVLCFIGYLESWMPVPYERDRSIRLSGVECVRGFYRDLKEENLVGDAACPRMYHSSLTKFLLRAKELQLSFYQDINKSL